MRCARSEEDRAGEKDMLIFFYRSPIVSSSFSSRARPRLYIYQTRIYTPSTAVITRFGSYRGYLTRYILVRSRDKSSSPPPLQPHWTYILIESRPWSVALRAESLRRRKRDSKKFLYLFLDLTQRMVRGPSPEEAAGWDRTEGKSMNCEPEDTGTDGWWTRGRGEGGGETESDEVGKAQKILVLDLSGDIRCRFYLYARVEISKIISGLSPARNWITI